MTTKEKNMLDRLASILDMAASLCGEIIGQDDASCTTSRDSPFRLLNLNGNSSYYPNVNFRLLSDIRAEETVMAVYLPYGLGSIRKRTRNNKNSRYTWWEGRFRHFTVTAKTQQEVLEKLKKITQTKNEDKSSAKNTKKQNNGCSLLEWVNYWYETYKEPYLRPNSKHGYYDAFAKIKNLTTPMKDLTPDELQQFFISIDGENSRRKVFDIVNAALRQAVVSGKIPKNPCEMLKRPKTKTEHKRAFTPAEQTAILGALPEKYSRLFTVLCCTGLRISEFLALTPDDIGDDEIRVNKMRNRDGAVEQNTKNRTSERFINYDVSLRENLEYCVSENYTYNGVKLAFGKTINKLGFTGVSVHSTRHTFASMCHLTHIDDLLTKKWLGHASLSMTKDVYTHFMKREISPFTAYFEKLKEFER